MLRNRPFDSRLISPAETASRLPLGSGDLAESGSFVNRKLSILRSRRLKAIAPRFPIGFPPPGFGMRIQSRDLQAPAGGREKKSFSAASD